MAEQELNTDAVYHLLGHEKVAITWKELVRLVNEGVLSADTMVSREGEGFAAALRSRTEFRHLLRDQSKSLKTSL